MPGNRRGDNTTNLNSPASGMKRGDSIPSLKPSASSGVGSGLTGGAGTSPRSQAIHSEKPEGSDAIASAVEAHLQRHQLLRLPRERTMRGQIKAHFAHNAQTRKPKAKPAVDRRQPSASPSP